MNRSRWSKWAAIAAAGLVTVIANVALADVPQKLTHQGRLYDTGGKPIDATLSVTFNLYEGLNDAVPAFSETLDVTFEDGYFSASIGDSGGLKEVLNGKVRYLGITVGSDAEMTPRAAVQSVPYALVAGDVIGDIHPTSVFIGATQVIDDTGKWVGDKAGLTGPAGPAGPKGDPGATGAKGDKGDAGAAGTNGTNGAKGDKGDTGTAGTNGTNGTNGAMGAKGDKGDTGNTGAQGPTGIVSTVSFNGQITTPIAGNATAWVFVGPTATVTTTVGQRLTGAGEIPIGLANAVASQTIDISLCYQDNNVAGAAINPLADVAYSTHRIFGELRTFPSAASKGNMAAGTWKVGNCLRNDGGAAAVSQADWANGWVQVTN